jgi:hypothetical protein
MQHRSRLDIVIEHRDAGSDRVRIEFNAKQQARARAVIFSSMAEQTKRRERIENIAIRCNGTITVISRFIGVFCASIEAKRDKNSNQMLLASPSSRAFILGRSDKFVYDKRCEQITANNLHSTASPTLSNG